MGPDTRLEIRPSATLGQDPARTQGGGRAEDPHTFHMAQAQTRPGAQAGAEIEPLPQQQRVQGRGLR